MDHSVWLPHSVRFTLTLSLAPSLFVSCPVCYSVSSFYSHSPLPSRLVHCLRLSLLLSSHPVCFSFFLSFLDSFSFTFALSLLLALALSLSPCSSQVGAAQTHEMHFTCTDWGCMLVPVQPLTKAKHGQYQALHHRYDIVKPAATHLTILQPRSVQSCRETLLRIRLIVHVQKTDDT